MTFPLVIPNVGYDGGLNSMLAVCATGMGVNLGRHVDMEMARDTFFDDEVITEVNQAYLDHDISIGTLTERVRDHFTDRGGAWGFKFSIGLNLLPIYRYLYPSMSIVVGGVPMTHRLNNVIAVAMQEDSILGATIPEVWADIEARAYILDQTMREVGGALVLPFELVQHYRQKALAKLAEHVGGDYRSGNIARMVDSAQRKLLHIYDESEVGSGYLAG